MSEMQQLSVVHIRLASRRLNTEGLGSTQMPCHRLSFSKNQRVAVGDAVMRADVDELSAFELAEHPAVEKQILERLRFVGADVRRRRRRGAMEGRLVRAIQDLVEAEGHVLDVRKIHRDLVGLLALAQLALQVEDIPEARVEIAAVGLSEIALPIRFAAGS